MKSPYWNEAGVTKTFGHPLELEWLDGLTRDAWIVDYGCGYGRLVGELQAAGFAHTEGVDVSAGLIARARDEHPDAAFSVLENPPILEWPDATVEAVLLFAVLTCIPDDAEQHRTIAELRRVLRPGGLLYISDYCLQNDQRNLDRYREQAGRWGEYGVFQTSDGAVCRHHEREHLPGLLGGFKVERSRDIPVSTMNGHPATATQLLARKS